MQHAVERVEAVGGEPLSPEHLRRIAPTNLEGINLRGTFEFPLAEYAVRILPSSASVHVEAFRKQSRSHAMTCVAVVKMLYRYT